MGEDFRARNVVHDEDEAATPVFVWPVVEPLRCEHGMLGRLHDAAGEIRNYTLYDYVLVNRDVAASVDTLVSIVKATRSRRDRMEKEIRPILETFRNVRD